MDDEPVAGEPATTRGGASRSVPDPAVLPRPWLASYPPGVPPSYDYPQVPLTRFLDDAARDFPDVAAMSFGGAVWTYAEVLEQTDRLAAALAELGVRRGTRVALLLPNLPAFPLVLFAVLRLGAVAVLEDPSTGERRLHDDLADTGCAVAVCVDSGLPLLQAVRARLPDLVHVVVTSAADWAPTRLGRVVRTLSRGRRGGYRPHPDAEVHALRDLIAAHEPIARQTPVTTDDPAVVVHTAGTGGQPRAVVLSHGGLAANAFQTRLWVPDSQAGKERIAAVAPFWHAYGLTAVLLHAVLSAATLLLVEGDDPREVLATVGRDRPTLLPAAPSLLARLAYHPGATRTDLGSIRVCLSGGAPLPADVARRLQALSGARVREGYGLTEAGFLTHANPVYGRAVEGSIGLPVTGTVAVVADLEDAAVTVPAGTPGELLVAGPQLMSGYWQRPDATVAARRDGWLRTGDVAVMDEQGFFTLVSRRQDLLEIGDEPVPPRRVEQVLEGHPAVAVAAVVAVSAGADRELVAFLVPAAGTSPSTDELLAHCRAELDAALVPQHLVVRSALPWSPHGEIIRRELRAARLEDAR